MREKFIIYQTLPRLSGNRVETRVPGSSFHVNGTGKFNDFTIDELAYVKNLGCTHIWFVGVLEHATQSKCSNSLCLPDPPDIVKGIAGSPYAIKDYFDVAHYLAVDHDNRIFEFEELIKRCHSSGLKVIIDFVPNHISRNYNSDMNPREYSDFGENDDTSTPFSQNNDFYYIPGKKFISPAITDSKSFYEYPSKVTGNNCFSESPSLFDWYETVKLNYGIKFSTDESNFFQPVPPVWNKMVDILSYWSKKGVDGFRCDMAEMVPCEFWKFLTDKLKIQFPHLVFIAEIYNPTLYKSYLDSGFDFLYDKVGLYDTLISILKGNSQPSNITSCWQSIDDIQNSMLNFMENHDEQRIASDFIVSRPEKGIPAVAVSLLLNRAPFMLYFGQELGERGMDSEGFSGIDGRTSIFDFWSLESLNNYKKGDYNNYLYQEYKFLLNISLSEPALKYGDTYDLQFANKDLAGYDINLFSFARFYKNELILIITNFSNLEIDANVTIPEHLFLHWNIEKGLRCKTIDLRSREVTEIIIGSDSLLKFKIDKNSYKIIKYLLQ